VSDLGLYAEDDDFQLGTAPTVTTTAGLFRASYARCALFAPGSLAYVKSYPLPGGAITACWLSAQIRPDDNPGGSNAKHFGLMDSATASKGLYIGPTAASYQKIGLYKWDGTTLTLLASEAGTSYIFGSLLKLDIQLIAYGASATVNVWINGGASPLISFTGNVAVSGVTTLDTVVISSSTSGNAYVSEVIVSTADTRTRSLKTKDLTGVGDTDAWTGAVSDVNEVTLNDATSVFTNTAALDEEFVGSALPAGLFTVTSVMATARCSATVASTATSIAVGVRSGGTTAPGTPVAQTTAWAMNESLMLLNPVTSAPFTNAEVNALQINLRSS
jgi:hypothetical protein